MWCFSIYSVIFLVWSIFFILYSKFLPSDVKAAASRTCGLPLCDKLWLSAFNSVADNTVINNFRSFCKFKAWCLHSTGEVYFFPATSITVSSYLHHLLENWLVSSTIYANWVHKLAGFENCNPCDRFLVQSTAEATSRVPHKPVSKAEPISPEIFGLIFQQYGESCNLLDISFICMCFLLYAGFSAFPSF